MTMNAKMIFIFFLFSFFAACEKEPTQPTHPIPNMTGVWETDSNTSPGWIFGLRPNGEFCQLEKTVTAIPVCGLTWYQSNDSVFISDNRLWVVQYESQSSVIVKTFDDCGEQYQMRLIK